MFDVERAGDAEVGHLRPAVSVEQDVLRLHVAVDQPVVVGESQGACNLGRHLERIGDVEPAPSHDELLEVLAVDVLEDDVLPAFLLAAVDHGHDIRMLELGDRARLPLEALDEVVVLVVLLVEELQRDVALEERVMGPVHAGHAAVPDDFFQLVASRNRLPDHARTLPGAHETQAWDQSLRARRSRRPTQSPPQPIP